MFFAKWIIAFIAITNFGGFVADALVPATARQHFGILFCFRTPSFTTAKQW